jgi:MoaA/NifB/PqqE/SkfB family radical SAM enzyme
LRCFLIQVDVLSAPASLCRETTGMGAVWCLLTGGEPLLRNDFADIHLGLKRLGLLVGVFTNACLVTPAHVELLRRYRRPGSYEAFMRGLDLLIDAGIKVRPKAMALRSNIHEFAEISRFCRERTKDYYRFDPELDGGPVTWGSPVLPTRA